MAGLSVSVLLLLTSSLSLFIFLSLSLLLSPPILAQIHSFSLPFLFHFQSQELFPFISSYRIVKPDLIQPIELRAAILEIWEDGERASESEGFPWDSWLLRFMTGFHIYANKTDLTNLPKNFQELKNGISDRYLRNKFDTENRVLIGKVPAHNDYFGLKFRNFFDPIFSWRWVGAITLAPKGEGSLAVLV